MHLHNHLFPEPDGARSFPQFGKVVDVNFTIKLLAVVDIEIQNEAIVINANIIQVPLRRLYKVWGGVQKGSRMHGEWMTSKSFVIQRGSV